MDDSQDIIISFNEIIPPITSWSIYLPNHIIPLTVSTCSSQKGGLNLDVFFCFNRKCMELQLQRNPFELPGCSRKG